MTIEPTLDRIAIRPEKLELKSTGGIIMPGNEKQNKNTGVVTAVGPGRYDSVGNLLPVGVSVGDKVVFFDQFEIEGLDNKFGDVVLVEEADIRAIIRD